MKHTLRISLLFLEIALIFTLFSFGIFPKAMAVVGNPDALVISWLDVGNVYPEILNITINDDNPITLIPNATKIVSCVAILRDYNGDADIVGVNASFYDSVVSSASAPDDNNDHYTNSSCEINADTGGFKGYTDDPYYSIANCTFLVEYYANAEDWVCNVTVNDTMHWTDTKWDTQTISPLLALGVPDLINYSEVNATEVSNEQLANVTNYGNIQINLSLSGYGDTPGDGYSMICTLGNIGTIDIEHEKYNLTVSNTSTLSQAQVNALYSNLTTATVIRRYELASRTDDLSNDAISSSYWRMYVPKGVAGTCNGTIIFGATQANGI